MVAVRNTRRLMSSRPDRAAQLVWDELSRGTPMSARDLAVHTGATVRYVRRVVRGLVAAGYAEVAGEVDSGGGFPAPLYRLVRRTGELAPIFGAEAGGPPPVRELNGEMTGAELRAARLAAGMSHRTWAIEALDVLDYRTAQRYEALERVPAEVEARVRAWAALQKSATRGAPGAASEGARGPS